MEDEKIDYTSILKLVRKRMGMTNEAMAIYLGVSKATVSLWESGKRTPPTNTLFWYLRSVNKIRCKTIECPQCKGIGKIDIYSLT